MSNILAFIGRAYSGKSTAANLVLDIDQRFKKRSFAGALKEAYSREHNVPLEILSAPKRKEQYRSGLIEYAWNTKKIHGNDYFAKKLFESIGAYEYAVIDDMRFFEELREVLKHNCSIFKIVANREARKRRGWIPDASIDEELSETELDLSAYTIHKLTKGRGGFIYNHADTEEDLRYQLQKILMVNFPPIVSPDNPALEEIKRKMI